MIAPIFLALAAQAAMPSAALPGCPPGGPPMGPPPGMGPPGMRGTGTSLADQAGTPAFGELLVRQGMSPIGAATVRRLAGPATTAADRAASEAADREVARAAVDPGDLAALTTALARRDSLVVRRTNERSRTLLRLLRPLSAADRAVLIAVIGTGGDEAGGGPGGPPPGGGPGGPPPGCRPA